MKCPKCDSNWFDGTRCIMCGYRFTKVTIKGYKEEKCSICGDTVRVPIFYGDETRGRKKINILCNICYEAKEDKVKDKDFVYTTEDYLKNTNRSVFNDTPICCWPK